MSPGHSKVVVNRCMSLDGFIAGPGHMMDWGGGRRLADFVAPEDFHEVATATGAMLVGRRTADVGERLQAEEPGSVDYPFTGPVLCLPHHPPEPPPPPATYLSGGATRASVLGPQAVCGCCSRHANSASSAAFTTRPRNVSASLACGSSSAGTGTSRNSQSGPQPSVTRHTSSRSGGIASRTASL